MDKEKIMKAAKMYVENCLDVEEGDNVLVLTDDGVTGEDELGQIRDAVIEVLDEEGYAPSVVSYKACTSMGAMLPPVVEAACLASDVLVSFSSSLILYTGNFPKIYQGGTTTRKLAMFPGGSSIKAEKGYFERMLPDTAEEIHQMADMTEKYGELIRDGKEHKIHLTAANGTDLTLNIGMFGGSTHTGICLPGTMELIPAGILSNGVDEGTAEGTLVTDYSTTLKKKPLQGPICFEIHDGCITSISGGEDADEFKAAIDAVKRPDRERYNIAEFGLGFNPRAKADGQVIDGENIYGGAHIGIGSNVLFGGSVNIPEWHIDCMVPYATVEMDGKLILKDGEYLY